MEDSLIKVVIADDHSVMRLGMELALSETPMLRLVASCSNSTDLIACLDSIACDVLVTDYAMPGGQHGDGLALIDYVLERHSSVGVVVMTGMDRPVIARSLVAKGVTNIVSKADDMHHLNAAVLAAFARRNYLSPSIAPLIESLSDVGNGLLSILSPREYQVLSLYVGGATINEIASLLGRSKQTVSSQKVRAMAKLNITSEADLFKHAAELGLR